MKLLSVEGLVTEFYTEDGVVKALDGVSFDVEKGETFSLVGETGCGKSVTMLSLLRILPPSAEILGGRVLFWDDGLSRDLRRGGKNVDLLALRNREMLKVRGSKIALITQDPQSSLDPLYHIEDQISEVLELHRGMDSREARKEVFNLMEQVELAPPKKIAHKYPHELSGGQRQRVVIAMALAARPSLIIADEPTTALDVTIQARILDLMEELKREYNTSLLLITHDLAVVAEVADRVGIMYAGSVVETAPIEELFENPLHPYTRGLLVAVPSITERKEEMEYIPGSVPNLMHPPSGCRFHPRCGYAKKKCSEDKPPLEEVEDKKGHKVACHYWEDIDAA